MVQGHVGISPWEFESPLRHHRKKGHRKVAFLLEKIKLGLLRVGGWVRIGCVWVHLVRLIHIRMCLPQYFVPRPHKRKVCIKGCNTNFRNGRVGVYTPNHQSKLVHLFLLLSGLRNGRFYLEIISGRVIFWVDKREVSYDFSSVAH